jgi:DNA polymerase, archaea type
MFEKTYIAGFDKITAGDICYGSKGEPLEYVERDGDRIKLMTPSGKVSTDISNIKLVQHEHYRSFRWTTPPGARIASAAAKGYGYHPRQLIAIGEWFDPLTEVYEGVVVNKRVNSGFGIARSIPDVLPVIWVDDSKIDLNYQPEPTEAVDSLPVKIRDYASVPKLYIDVETTGLDTATDRVTMFGVRDGNGVDAIFTDPDERQLLIDAIVHIRTNRPDLMFLHNGYGFDIPFIIARCELHGISHLFSECDRLVSRMIKDNAHGVLKRVFAVDRESPEYGGKMVAYEAFGGDCTIVDTMVAIGLWDTGKKLPNLKLKPTVINLKLRADTRLELTNDEIQLCWVNGDLDRLREYLIFDLEDTQLLADKLMSSIWYQQAYLPGVKLMDLVHKNTGFKIQQMYAYLCPERPEASASIAKDKSIYIDSKADYGGGLTGAITGVYRNVCKLDVASLYPSLMVRYRLGSRKDPHGRYISVLAKMLTDRLAYKQAGKDGDDAAAGMAEAIKLLMNSGYGFLGTQGYTFNDMENAAIVTAYGRVILKLMCQTIEDNDGVLISADTDGIYFSHPNPDLMFERVSESLPQGINIELEKRDLVMFSLSKKNYCLYYPNGKVEMKGNTFLSNKTKIETDFTKTYPVILISQGQLKADEYYRKVTTDLISSITPVSDVSITAKILKDHKRKLQLLGLDKPATVTYYYARHDLHGLGRQYHKCRNYQAFETLIESYPSVPYFGKYYAHSIECLRASMLGLPEPKQMWQVKPKIVSTPRQKPIQQLTLGLQIA